MPITLDRKQKAGDMIILARGSKHDLGKVLDLAKTIRAEMGVTGNTGIDFVCFGIDATGHANEQFCIFYSQKNSPGNEISLKEEDANSALFYLEPSRLPRTVEKLVFTASVQDAGSMRDISGMDVKIHQNNVGFYLQLSRGDFSAHKSIIIAELALGSIWQLEAKVTGFEGDLGDLMKHFGIEVSNASASSIPPPIAVPNDPIIRRDGKIWIDGEEFVESPDDWV